jgi:hypothetical protein
VRGVYSHLDRVFLKVVNKVNRLIVALNTIDYHTCTALSSAHLQDSDMVDSFPVLLFNYSIYLLL